LDSYNKALAVYTKFCEAVLKKIEICAQEIEVNVSISSKDLEQIMDYSNSSLLALHEGNILVSGASGFVGTWITSALIFANKKLGLNVQVTAIVRDREKMLSRLHEAPNNLKILEIDYLRESSIDLKPNFTHIIQSTTPSMPGSGSLDQENVSQVSYRSNAALLNLAKNHKTPPTFCHLSSGAVYGSPEQIVGPIEERIPSEDNSSLSEYAFIKKSLERDVEDATHRGDIRGCNPRLFAFGGPFLQLDAQFAIGNFMQNTINKEPILIKGNPSTIRSYMYPTDLVIYLLALLNIPTINPIHIGSNQSITMLELATVFSNCFDLPIEIQTNTESVFSSYFPSTTKTEKFLGVEQRTSLEDSLLRWKDWLTSKPRN
jgi:dTDP-glucose 4,6-dehydratase